MKFTRRDFLKFATDVLLGLGGVLSAGGLLRFFGYAADPPPPVEYNLGPAANFPLRTSVVITTIPAYLRHDSHGYLAFSLKCTHLGCTVEKKGDSFECPCHGSAFDNNGELTRGPATRRLEALRVEENENGDLIVYVS